jgi:hypothetical protein
VADSNLPEEIRNKKLLVVEGTDDIGFFVEVLKKQNILGVYVTGLGGKYEFNDELPRLTKISGFSNITHFGIIRDKDDKSQNDAFESVANTLRRKTNLQNIPTKHGKFDTGKPRIGIFIIPGDSIEGNILEDLCLKTVEKHEAMSCVNEFISCVSKLKTKPKNMSKAKTHAFLAAQQEFANSIGLASEKGYWDFSSPVIDELRQFLDNFK